MDEETEIKKILKTRLTHEQKLFGSMLIDALLDGLETFEQPRSRLEKRLIKLKRKCCPHYFKFTHEAGHNLHEIKNTKCANCNALFENVYKGD